MINNILKVVGAENSNSPTSPGSSTNTSDHSYAFSSSAGGSGGATTATTSSLNHNRYQPTHEGKSNNNNLTFTIGGFLNNFQGTRIVADALDSTGVMGHTSWKASTDGMGSGGGGRSFNAGGRGYYSEGSNCGNRRRRGEHPPVSPPFPTTIGGNIGGGSSGGSSDSHRGMHRPKKGKLQSSGTIGKKSAAALGIGDNDTYMGRKMVASVSHLYEVVDDKEAYENFDQLMEATRHAREQASERLLRLGQSSDAEQDGASNGSGSRRSSGSRSRRRRRRNTKSSSSHSREVSNQEEKQNWARLKEEELVDRMLSQFPEFGTNRPTPFTVMDEDENASGDDYSYNSSLQHSGGVGGGLVATGEMSANSSGVAAAKRLERNNPKSNTSSSNTHTSAATNNSYASSRFFTDEASDIIGRLFSGMNSGDNVSNTGSATSAANATNGRISNTSAAQEGFQRTASFGSMSSMSTAASATGSRKSGNVSGVPSQNRTITISDPRDPSFDAASTSRAGNDAGKEQVVWDQDEIDLWNTTGSSITPAASTKVDASSPETVRYADSGRLGVVKDHQKKLLNSNREQDRQQNGESVNEELLHQTGDNHWASRRRRHNERRKKQLQDWDTALQGVISNLPPLPTNPITSVMSPGVWDSDMSSDFAPQQQKYLLTEMQTGPRDEMPFQKTTDEQQHRQRVNVANREGRDGGSSGGSVIVDDGKQHWMPDNLCKICYSCEAPFTMLRRKHHCRVCGMIFCSACSAYFVQISSTNDWNGVAVGGGGTGASLPDNNNNAKSNAGTMRTCKMCYDHLSERGLGVIVRGSGTTTKESVKKSDGAASANLQMPEMEVNATKQPSSTLALLDKPEIASSSEGSGALDNATTNLELAEQFATSFQGGSKGATLSSNDFHALSITKQRLDEERRRREEQERLDAEAAASLAEKILAEKEEAEKVRGGAGGSSGGPSLFRRKSRGRQIKWKTSPSNPESNTSSEETIKAGSNGVEVSVSGNDTVTAEKAGAGDASGPFHDPLHYSNTKDVADQPVLSSSFENRSCIAEALAFGPGSQSKDAKISAKIHLGMVAADYLEKLGRELLQTDAPLLLEEIKRKASSDELVRSSVSASEIESKLIDLWVNTLMTLATRCCATVEPDVKKGDLLDIRPYCKLKVIPGGSVEDSAYLSGVAFHKNVSHKKMARVIPNAKIMILSGGIEYTRTENRIASLDALLEQEERYMEILVTKIFKLHPDVLITGKSVCRKAQELLLRANIVLLQYTKATLMMMIARQTGATVLSSIDHVMNSTILGYCSRFRLVSFRDNDVWVDTCIESSEASSSDKKSVPDLLSQTSTKYFERQQALAARRLGEGVLDGMDAVTLGLSKRGVVKTYVMIEGCPKELGCTVVLRGASRPALKMVKRVLRFLINCCYNMKLETSYILERCCRLPPSYKIPSAPCCSSSLCVDFGLPPNNRKARPWNGGKNDPAQRSLSGKITPLDQQAILITSVWMTDKTQCCPAEVKGICYYSMQDVSLGQFLRDSCFNLSLKCQNPSCKKSVLDHSLSFIHGDGLINISVERLDNPIPTSSLQKQQKDVELLAPTPKQESAPPHYEQIATWTYCQKCSQVVTPLTFLSKQTWQWSFGKFLEVYFYNRDAIINAPGHCCSCRMQTSSHLFFGCGSLAAKFTYEKISPYSVFCRRHLPFDEQFHRNHSFQDLEHISTTSSSLFAKYGKQIDMISRETRELFGSAMNKPEHLQAVLSELNLVSSEVDNAMKVLQEKISSVTAKYSVDSGKKAEVWSEYNDALFNFPGYARRYLFMLASAWNERLSAAGQALSAMKKIQHASGSSRGDSAVVPVIVGDASTEDVIEGIKRIRMLQETYSRNYNVAKMTMPRSNKEEGGLFEGNILPDGRLATLERETEIDDEEFYSDHEHEIDFEDNIDADVLASRNRVYSPQASSSSKKSLRQRPKKMAGGKKPSDLTEEPVVHDKSSATLGFANNYDSGQSEPQGKSKTVTAGGAVKSALTRFFNRGGNKEDPYIVDLGFFGKGRPRLQPGIAGLVVPVFDDQPSTIIAHSLASADYDVQFKQFLSATSHSEPRSEKHEPSRKDIERRMLGRNKSHIKHTFRDFDEKGQQLCKFVCTTFWSVQFNSVRSAFMSPQSSGDTATGSTKSSGVSRLDIEKSYVRSLATSFAWAASGGKSGAAFSRTTDDRFVIKCISRTELQMFLDCAPAYFEYLSKAFFHGLPTVLCKIVGVYQIGYHNRVTGKRTMEQVAVMQNIFYGRKISKVFDLKGSLRGRFTRQGNTEKEKNTSKHSAQHGRSKYDATSDSDSFLSGDEEDDDTTSTSSGGMEKDEKGVNNAEKGEKNDKSPSIATLLDGDFLEFTSGRPLPLTDRAKAVFHMSILNDTLFLSIINVLDYSILVGIDEEKMELVVGIIDFMRQYDILKQMERVGKSLPMVVGSEAPTIIQPPLYKQRFTNAMERYFMTVPSKWTTI